MVPPEWWMSVPTSGGVGVVLAIRLVGREPEVVVKILVCDDDVVLTAGLVAELAAELAAELLSDDG